ncbi:hypothetical protein PoB_003013100 [Plakobranchus ocellatus]|uniref:Uncharacterized protein n=1 Tax=Plakobranchus ocellatus TaxID=259542 RepID=A0AAV3ZXF0_9GAST|nr:hypothetical protein PoB_003013100 [Plakobranchus ocellatus]
MEEEVEEQEEEQEEEQGEEDEGKDGGGGVAAAETAGAERGRERSGQLLRNGSCLYVSFGGVGGTVVSESTLRSAGTILSRVRAPPQAPWPDGGPESLRSPCCGLAYISKGFNPCEMKHHLWTETSLYYTALTHH